eukprot:gnl/Hemi2/16355_TR5446_c0_g1_i1.p1 gnl/Hemi2/16355_TR5446_c0_g1~~gnl/Hemi2/16355_TR5446_c0_g1_i1.p1  ORF type:complete len:514 (-),score=171.44 gnl/Hemi2/16355_TR5446_c0_g1_i1:151-1692(-)
MQPPTNPYSQPGYGQPGYGQPMTYAPVPAPGSALQAPQGFGYKTAASFSTTPVYTPVNNGTMSAPLLQYSPPDHQQRFPESPSYKDPIFAVLFLACLGASAWVMYSQVTWTSSNPDATSWSQMWASPGVRIGTISIFVAVVMAVIWLMMIRAMAQTMVWVALLLPAVLAGLGALACLATGQMVPGIVFLVMALLNLLYIWWVKERIPFAAALLQIAATCVQQYPGTILVTIVTLIPQVAYVCFCSIAIATISNANTGNEGSNTNSAWYAIVVFLLFSMFWVLQVLKNIVHVTVSGVFASWYFLQSREGSAPTCSALRRACTYSFGSICFGSLIVAFLQTLRALVNNQKNNKNANALAVCLADCILGCLEKLMEFFNKFAYTYVAIYGKSFMEAASAVVHLFRHRGFEAVVNENMVGGVLSLSALAVGFFTGLISGLWAYFAGVNEWGAVAGVAVLIGAVIGVLVMEVVDAAVTTTFVCFAEDPKALNTAARQAEYQLLVSTWPGGFNDAIMGV